MLSEIKKTASVVMPEEKSNSIRGWLYARHRKRMFVIATWNDNYEKVSVSRLRKFPYRLKCYLKGVKIVKIKLNNNELYRLMRERNIETVRQLSKESGINEICLYGAINRRDFFAFNSNFNSFREHIFIFEIFVNSFEIIIINVGGRKVCVYFQPEMIHNEFCFTSADTNIDDL
ncbi:MAG: hypothetical protein K2K02_05160 [Ruminococcus sp.]|nr:hypothetical protein [Ruminococcus sp.]